MAGIAAGNAGTLSINLVAEIARLQADLDKAKKLVNAASSDIAKSAKHANDNLKLGPGMFDRWGTASQGAGKKASVAGHHLSNLSFQLQDIVVGLQAGQKPFTVLLQQGGQIGQIMGQAGLGVGGLAKAVGGMTARFVAAHPVMTAVAVAAGATALRLKFLAEEINAQRGGEIEAYAKSLGLTAKQIEKAGGAAVTTGDLIGGLWDVLREAVGFEDIFAGLKGWFIDTFDSAARNAKKNLSEIYALFAAAVDGIKVVWKNIGPIIGDAVISGVNLAISAIEKLINKAIAGVVSLTQQLGPLGKLAGITINAVAGSVDLGRLDNPYAGAGANAADAFVSAYRKHLTSAQGWFDRTYDQWMDRAVDRAKGRMSSALEKEAEKAGKKAGKKAAENFGMSFAEAFRDLSDYFKEIQKVIAENAKIEEQIEALQREARLIGIVGWERERLLKIMEREAQLRPILLRLQEAELAGNASLARDLRKQIDLLNEKYRLEIKNGNAEEAWRKAEDAARDYNNNLLDIISSLQQIGGFGGVLGSLLGILTGNTSAIRGPIGDVLNIGVKNSSGEIRKLGDVLKEAIGDQSGILAKAIEGMGVGLMASTAILGKQGTIGQLGSAIGGAIGGKVGEKFLTKGLEKVFKGLGDFAGPLGSILGGLAGSLIGKLFSGTKRGSAIISGGDVSGFYGNSGKMKDQAGQIAGGLLDTLQQIANQFGTTLDEQAMGKISIGVRDGKYAVDTLGRGYTKSSISGVKSFGTDAEAAVEYALKLMLDRGAIKMREGSMKIIKEATDLQEGLTRALQFEEIMNELEGGGSQLVAQVRAIRTQFTQYIAVMRQAGASVADLTRVQEMQAQRINALIAQAGDSYRSTFYTDAQNTAFAQQTIKSVLDPLGKGWIDTVAEYMAEVEAAQAAVNAATDENRDAALAYLETLYGLSDEFGALKAAAEAAAAAAAAAKAQKEADAAAAAAERERKKQDKERAIEAAQDVLRQAFDRQAGELQQTIDKFAALGDSLRDFRDSLTDTVSTTANAARLLAKFKEIGRAASLGDAEAMGGLAGAGKDYLAAAKSQAASFEEYQRAVALVRRVTEGAIGAADAGKTVAQQQLDQLKSQVGQLIDLNAGVVSVEKAIQELLKLTGGGTANPNPSTPPPSGNPGQTRNTSEVIAEVLARAEQRRLENREAAEARKKEREDKRLAKVEERLTEQQPVLERAARATERTNRILERLSPNGVALATVPIE